MNKRIAVLAGCLCVSVFVSCSRQQRINGSVRVGVLSLLDNRQNVIKASDGAELISFQSLNEMLLGLKAGKVDFITLPASVSFYITGKHPELAEDAVHAKKYSVRFSFGVPVTDTPLMTRLNSAVYSLKQDGTVEKLYNRFVSDSAETQPIPETLPVIPDADTVRIVVTGDLPPLDYVSEDGIPAGFNTAFLSELSKRAKLNIKLVQSDAASRAAMLASGRADAVFWVRQIISYDTNRNVIIIHDEKTDGIVLTDYYLEDKIIPVKKR